MATRTKKATHLGLFAILGIGALVVGGLGAVVASMTGDGNQTSGKGTWSTVKDTVSGAVSTATGAAKTAWDFTSDFVAETWDAWTDWGTDGVSYDDPGIVKNGDVGTAQDVDAPVSTSVESVDPGLG